MLKVTTAASSTDIVDLATVKDELSITDSAQDTRLSRYIKEASSKIVSYCCQPLAAQTYTQTEYLAYSYMQSFVRERNSILLGVDNVTGITSVTMDGTVVSSSLYEYDGSQLFYLDGYGMRTPWSGTKVVVVFTAGFSLPSGAPADLSRAAIDAVVWIYLNRGRDQSIKSEAVLDVSDKSYFQPTTDDGLPEHVENALEPYKKVVIP
jgi:hypothetical protein